MATKRAIELGRRLHQAKGALVRAVPDIGVAWRQVLRVERAAIAVGEHRERVRRAKRMGRSEPGDRSERGEPT